MLYLWILLRLHVLIVTSTIVVSVSDIGRKNAPLHPFYVEIIELSGKDQGWHICGGSLIEFDTVLTAAHCVLDLSKSGDVLYKNKSWLAVVDAPFNVATWTQFATRHSIRSIVVHNFNSNFHNDVAIIKLDTPLRRSATTDIIPLCPTGTELPSMAKFTGLGVSYFKSRGFIIRPFDRVNPKVLQEAVAYRDDCSKWEKEPGFKSYDGFICYFNFGKASSCNGDSGGPLFVEEKGQAKCLLGIICTGKDRCPLDSKVPPIYTHVPYFYQWIVENSNKLKS